MKKQIDNMRCFLIGEYYLGGHDFTITVDFVRLRPKSWRKYGLVGYRRVITL